MSVAEMSAAEGASINRSNVNASDVNTAGGGLQQSVDPMAVMQSFQQGPMVMGGLIRGMKEREIEMEREYEEAMRKAKVRNDRKMEEEWRRGMEEGGVEDEVRCDGSTSAFNQ